jgi:trimethylguanosine synthase
MFLPRNIDLNQLADMSLSVDPPWSVEVSPSLLILCQADFSYRCHNGLSLQVEKNFLNGKLKAITAYFEEQDC